MKKNIAILGILACLLLESQLSAQWIVSIKSGRWSDPTSWVRLSGGISRFPQNGDLVTINSGHHILLDTNRTINKLGHLDIDGIVEAEDGRNYRLGAARIDIGRGGAGGAALRVGSAASPFRSLFELTLHDQGLSPLYGNPQEHLSLVVHPGSALELHGRVQKPNGLNIASWLKLAHGEHLEPGDSEMKLEYVPNWRVGDRLVIASTDFDMNQAEVVTIKKITGDRVLFSPAVVYHHHGRYELNVDERAEVGLLSRNITVRGKSATPLRGGHIMARRAATGPAGDLRLQGVALTEMGWYGALGRYPIHWHLCGPVAPGSNYVRNCSIEKSYNRAITIHQTDGVEINKTVFYDHFGHGIYLEDRVEVKNTIKYNLGLLTKKPDPTGFVPALGDIWPTTGQKFFVTSDNEVSTYWITHSENTIIGNVAAGSEVHGIWYDPLFTAHLQQVGTWIGNAAHSNGSNGFHQEDARPFPYDSSLANPYDAVFEFNGFTGYKNRQAGIWNRTYGQAVFKECHLADNRIGVYFSSEGFQHDTANHLIGILGFDQQLTGTPIMSAQILRDSIIVGETENIGTPTHPTELSWPAGPRSLPLPHEPQLGVKGVEIYDGFIGVENTIFRNFHDVTLVTPQTRFNNTFSIRPSAAFFSRGERSILFPGIPWGVDPRSSVARIDIDDSVDHAVLYAIGHAPLLSNVGVPVNAPNGVYVRAANGLDSMVLFDLDGSLGGPANCYYVTENPLLLPAGTPPATKVGLYHLEGIPVPGPATPHTGNNYAQLMVTMPSDSSTTTITRIKFTAKDRNNGTLDIYDALGSRAVENKKIFVTTLLTNNPTSAAPFETYELSYPSFHAPQNDPRQLVLKFQFGENERNVLFKLPYFGGPPTSILCYPETNPAVSIYAFPITAPNLAAALPQFHDGIHDEHDFYYDAASQSLYLKPILYDPLSPAPHPVMSGRAMVLEINP